MNIVNASIEIYAHEHSTPESKLINNLVTVSEKQLRYTDMLSGRVVGDFLAMMVRISGACRILEVGTFTGFSALYMAEALPEKGEIITCECNERYEEIARIFFEKSNSGKKIHLMMGQALETISDLEGLFDLVFLDADKENYPNYYEMILPKLRSGGIMIVDNVLWSGAVLDPPDNKTEAIDKLNKMIRDDTRVEHVLLTVRDGLQLVRKK